VVASISCPLGRKILAAQGQPEQTRGLGHEPSVRLNEAAFAPARRSKNIFGVWSIGPERLLTSRRIHEGMDWGAAARKRSAARNLVRTDRDNGKPKRTRPRRGIFKA
jgi:hypothetical protein